jgi:hypothetical protein
MKRHLIWSLILLLMMGIAGCSPNSPAGFKPGSEPDGFAGIKWGAEFSGVKSDMTELRSISDPAKPQEKITIFCARKGDDLRMGEARLDGIEYVFWQEKFAEARITAAGPGNFDHLKKFLFEKYGTVDKPFQGAYSWDGNIARVSLRYDDRAQTSLLRIASTKIASQEVKALFEKDKD